MRVYLVQGDSDYMFAQPKVFEEELLLDDVADHNAILSPDLTFHMRLDFGSPKHEGVETDCPHPDVGSALVLSGNALAALDPVLRPSGHAFEIVPPHPKGYKLFVCYREVDALDIEKSDCTFFDDGKVWKVARHELRAEALASADVFRLKHQRHVVYVSDTFVRLTEEAGLTGFQFKPIWSSESGGIPIDPDHPFGHFLAHTKERTREKRRRLREQMAGRQTTP